MPQLARFGYLRSKQMKLPLVIFLLGLAVTGAMAQSAPRDRNETPPGPPVAAPFQALGNVIRNPDADRPHRATPVTPQQGTPNNPQASPPANLPANPQDTVPPSR
jgi:hypothetical protein